MDPESTFKIWGSSSILVSRRILPTRVIMNLLASCEARSSMSKRIVLNLKIVKGRSSSPTLVCRNKIGPLESRRIATATGIQMNISNGRIRTAPMISVSRFIISRFQLTNLLHPTYRLSIQPVDILIPFLHTHTHTHTHTHILLDVV